MRRRGDLIGRGTVRLAARALIAAGEAPMIYLVGELAAEVSARVATRWERLDDDDLAAGMNTGDEVSARLCAALAAAADLVVVADDIAAARRDVARARRAGVPIAVGVDGLRAYLAPSRPARVG